MTDRSLLTPLDDAHWPETIADLRDGFAGRLDVYRVLARHPALIRAWTGFREHVVLNSTLGPEQSEVVILRTAHRRRAAYEWAHHVVRGRDRGLSDARIAALSGPLADMGPDDRMLARAVDELVDDACISPPLRAALVDRLGAEGTLDLMATVGAYTLLAFVVKTFETPVDADIADHPPLSP